MKPLLLHALHEGLKGQFAQIGGAEMVNDYGDFAAEHRALRLNAGLLDLSYRSRLTVTGADRQRFLNGQVTNNVAILKPGEGCYAALVTAKGKIESDLNIYCLPGEILLDFEHGLAGKVSQRLEKFIIADDVEVRDLAPHSIHLSIQGPASFEVINHLGWSLSIPPKAMSVAQVVVQDAGEVYLANIPRSGSAGFDLFLQASSSALIFQQLQQALRKVRGGAVCGWQSLECARIEAGHPRYGVDMDETNLVPETGIEGRAVSYSKGCYIGQEVIARIRTYGQVARTLRGFILADALEALPIKGDQLLLNKKEVGFLTSAVHSPALKKNIALGYLRREVSPDPEGLTVRSGGKETLVRVTALPFPADGGSAPQP